MSLCAKPLVCDTPLRVTRSLRSLESYSLTKTNPSCVSHSTCRRLISNFWTCRIGCEVGQDFFERADRASNDHNFQAIHIPYIALHVFRVITNFCQPFRTSHCTVLCGNSTIYEKLFINCKHLSVINRIKTSGSSGRCEYLNVPMCQTVELWHTSPRPSLAVLARKL